MRAKGGGRNVLIAVLALLLVLAVLMQQAIAAGLMRWLAGLWVGTLEIVVSLFAAVFGA